MSTGREDKETHVATLDSILLKDQNDAQQPNANISGNKDVFVGKLMSAIVKLTVSTNAIPSSDGSTNNFEYHISTDPLFLPTAQRLSLDLLKVICDLVKFVNPSISLPSLSECYEDTSILYEGVIDTLDDMLESTDLLLDNMDPNIRAKISSSSLSSMNTYFADKKRLLSLDIPKPQQYFMHQIENSRNHPFCPKIRHKPHALVPLHLKELRYDRQGDNVVQDENDEEDENDNMFRPLTFYAHPYEYELSSLSYTPFQLMDISDLQLSMPPADQPFEYIDDENDLGKIIDELTSYKEIAIDLEHHSHRTFAGITCLMQISTRDKDYVLDTISLRNKMFLLNNVFVDPSIVKVFHGCRHDIEWLQRDFGLYIVNCFDTYFAAKELRYPALSLAHLAKVSCGIVMDKKYQIADWRLRPLPEEMICYAKNDTHYLLFIYDFLRKEIWKKIGLSGIKSVLESSKSMCIRRYEKDVFRLNDYKKLLSSRSGDGNPVITDDQERVLKKLWDWRDHTARAKDESLSFIMTNRELLRISISLPSNEKELLQNNNIPNSTRIHAKEIIGAIHSNSTADNSFTPAKFHPTKSPIMSVNFTPMKSKFLYVSNKRKAKKQILERKRECNLPYIEDMIIDSEIDSNSRWGEHGKLEGYSTLLSLKSFSFLPTDISPQSEFQHNTKCINIPAIVKSSSPTMSNAQEIFTKLDAVHEKILHRVSCAQLLQVPACEQIQDMETVENFPTAPLDDAQKSSEDGGHHEGDKYIGAHTRILIDKNVVAEVPIPLAEAYNITVPEMQKKNKRRRSSGSKTEIESSDTQGNERLGEMSEDLQKFDYGQLRGLKTMSTILDKGGDDSGNVRRNSKSMKKHSRSNEKASMILEKQRSANPYFKSKKS